VSAPGICWSAAKAAAEARTYQGMKGYLATVTFEGEKDFLKGRAQGQYWFGASDAAVEGEWRWQSGPEAGRLIWTGGPNGIGAAYTHWLPGQPDNFTTMSRPMGEDYGMLYANSGLWNDAPDCYTDGNMTGYLVEYGGMESCTPVLFSLGTVTITVGPAAAQARMAGPVASAPAAQSVLEAAPNPSAGQFQVRVVAGNDGPAQLDLFDMQGRRVRSIFGGSLAAGEQRMLPVDASELATGLYVVRMQSGTKVQHLRVVIQK
jgi:hypothetical protein